MALFREDNAEDGEGDGGHSRAPEFGPTNMGTGLPAVEDAGANNTPDTPRATRSPTHGSSPPLNVPNVGVGAQRRPLSSIVDLPPGDDPAPPESETRPSGSQAVSIPPPPPIGPQSHSPSPPNRPQTSNTQTEARPRARPRITAGPSSFYRVVPAYDLPVYLERALYPHLDALPYEHRKPFAREILNVGLMLGVSNKAMGGIGAPTLGSVATWGPGDVNTLGVDLGDPGDGHLGSAPSSRPKSANASTNANLNTNPPTPPSEPTSPSSTSPPALTSPTSTPTPVAPRTSVSRFLRTLNPAQLSTMLEEAIYPQLDTLPLAQRNVFARAVLETRRAVELGIVGGMTRPTAGTDTRGGASLAQVGRSGDRSSGPGFVGLEHQHDAADDYSDSDDSTSNSDSPLELGPVFAAAHARREAMRAGDPYARAATARPLARRIRSLPSSSPGSEDEFEDDGSLVDRSVYGVDRDDASSETNSVSELDLEFKEVILTLFHALPGSVAHEHGEAEEGPQSPAHIMALLKAHIIRWLRELWDLLVFQTPPPKRQDDEEFEEERRESQWRRLRHAHESVHWMATKHRTMEKNFPWIYPYTSAAFPEDVRPQTKTQTQSQKKSIDHFQIDGVQFRATKLWDAIGWLWMEVLNRMEMERPEASVLYLAKANAHAMGVPVPGMDPLEEEGESGAPGGGGGVNGASMTGRANKQRRWEGLLLETPPRSRPSRQESILQLELEYSPPEYHRLDQAMRKPHPHQDRAEPLAEPSPEERAREEARKEKNRAKKARQKKAKKGRTGSGAEIGAADAAEALETENTGASAEWEVTAGPSSPTATATIAPAIAVPPSVSTPGSSATATALGRTATRELEARQLGVYVEVDEEDERDDGDVSGYALLDPPTRDSTSAPAPPSAAASSAVHPPDPYPQEYPTTPEFVAFALAALKGEDESVGEAVDATSYAALSPTLGEGAGLASPREPELGSGPGAGKSGRVRGKRARKLAKKVRKQAKAQEVRGEDVEDDGEDGEEDGEEERQLGRDGEVVDDLQAGERDGEQLEPDEGAVEGLQGDERRAKSDRLEDRHLEDEHEDGDLEDGPSPIESRQDEADSPSSSDERVDKPISPASDTTTETAVGTGRRKTQREVYEEWRLSDADFVWADEPDPLNLPPWWDE